MPSLRDFVGQELTWVHPHLFKNVYELRAGETCLATLSRSGILKQVSLGTAGDQQWRFARTGFLGGSLAVFPGPNETGESLGQPLATLKRKWNGHGDLRFYDGRTYTWSHIRTGFFSVTWFWSGPEGQLLSMRKRRLLEIAPYARNLPEMPLLALFGLYLTLIREEEQEAAAAAAG